MRLRDTIILLVCIFITAGLLIGAGSQLDNINRQRQDMKLVIDKPENLPPSLAIATVATGAFRGLLVDFLWIRADRMKEQGQFFDAKQLAEWITVLQPRFATVWQFQAWNMAYNISVAVPETQPEQRWRWVRNGYELIRDEAIDKYKLSDIGLYHELARIFQHKIGGISDDAHKYYKLQLASQMSPLLSSVDVQLNDEDNKYFDLLAKAPSSWQDVLKDANIVDFVTMLKAADDKFLKESDFAENYIALRQNSGKYKEDAGKVIDKFRGTETLKKFDIFARAYQLRTVWKLDPVFMRKVNHLYGPVDWTGSRVFVNSDVNNVKQDPNSHLPLNWRHADSHAVYWAEKGLEIASSRDRLSDSLQQADNETGSPAAAEKPDYSANETNTDRIVVHSLQNLFRMGKLIVVSVERQITSNDPAKPPQTVTVPEVFLRPDLSFFTSYNDTILRMIKKYDNSNDRGASQTMRDGHRNMMKNAVLLFYQSGHREQSQVIYDTMRKLYPMPEFNVSLVEYARSRLLDELKSIGIQDATGQITAILKQGYYFYSIRDDDAAAGSEKDAKDIFDYYKLNNAEDSNRTTIPDFDKMKAASMQDFRDDEQYPEYIRKDLFLNRLYIDNPDAYKILIEQDRKKAEKKE
jgi:hypothetical protein